MNEARAGRRKADRKSASFYLEREHIDLIDELWRRGMFESKSHVVDTALANLATVYRPLLASVTENEAA